MTKNKLLAVASFLAIYSGVVAANVLRTGQISIYADQGFGALTPNLFSFLGLSCIAATVKQKYWRIGAILAALAALTRSCITSFPEERASFAIATLAISAVSIVSLAVSWRYESYDLSWWNRTRGDKSYKPALLIFAVVAIIAIFLFWGRGWPRPTIH